MSVLKVCLVSVFWLNIDGEKLKHKNSVLRLQTLCFYFFIIIIIRPVILLTDKKCTKHIVESISNSHS